MTGERKILKCLAEKGSQSVSMLSREAGLEYKDTRDIVYTLKRRMKVKVPYNSLKVALR